MSDMFIPRLEEFFNIYLIILIITYIRENIFFFRFQLIFPLPQSELFPAVYLSYYIFTRLTLSTC